jgi:hypothetical protein
MQLQKQKLRLEAIHRKLVKLSLKPARQRMQRAAFALPPLKPAAIETPVEVHFLTGRNYWYQTIFCAYSLLLHSGLQPRIVFHDDGTLSKEHADLLLRTIPNSSLRTIVETSVTISKNFPITRFPVLNKTTWNLTVMRKLTLMHAGSSGWKLFLDSDMLFVRTPKLLIDWLREPQEPCHLIDISRCYGYSDALMSSLVEGQIPGRLNAGLWGMRSEEINWKVVEHWATKLIEGEGMKYLLEQAMTAMLFAGRSSLPLPREEYVVCPRPAEAINPKAVLHHYAGDTRPLMIRHGWKRIRDQAATKHLQA